MTEILWVNNDFEDSVFGRINKCGVHIDRLCDKTGRYEDRGAYSKIVSRSSIDMKLSGIILGEANSP